MNIAVGDKFVWRTPEALDADLKETNLIIDTAWHEFDLSSIIPNKTKAVFLSGYIIDNAVNTNIKIASTSQTVGIQTIYSNTQVIGIAMPISGIVKVDSEKKIDYNVETGMDIVYIVVLGWWI